MVKVIRASSFNGLSADRPYVCLIEDCGGFNFNPSYVINRERKRKIVDGIYVKREFLAFVVASLMSCGKTFDSTQRYVEGWFSP